VASLATLIAGLAGSVQRSTVGSSAVAGDVAQLAASVALHGLSLAVAGEVVGTAALVAGSRARTASETTTAKATETTTTHWGTAAHGTNRVRAGTSEMAGLATVVATSAGTSATQAKSRAVSLDVTKTLAVIALLGLRRARQRAAVGFVARLLAVVAEALSGGADLGIVTNVATLVASTSRKRRHDEIYSDLVSGRFVAQQIPATGLDGDRVSKL